MKKVAAAKDPRAGIKAARLIRDEKLAGRSPRQAGADKANLALLWVYKWGWSSPSILDIISNSARRGLAARLVKNGLLMSTRTASGGAVKGVPAFILTLTDTGLAEVERNLEDGFMQYEQNPWKAVPQDILRHDHLTQMATAASFIDKKIKDFQTPKQMAEKSADGIKQPDSVWILPNGEKMGIEVELTQKHDRQLDQFIRGCVIALSTKDGQAPRFDLISIISDSKGVMKNYKGYFSAGAKYSIWGKDSRGYWVKKSTAEVPEAVSEKIVWQFMDDKKKKEEQKKEAEEV